MPRSLSFLFSRSLPVCLGLPWFCHSPSPSPSLTLPPSLPLPLPRPLPPPLSPSTLFHYCLYISLSPLIYWFTSFPFSGFTPIYLIFLPHTPSLFHCLNLCVRGCGCGCHGISFLPFPPKFHVSVSNLSRCLYPSVYPSVNLSIAESLRLFVCLSVRLSHSLSVRLANLIRWNRFQQRTPCKSFHLPQNHNLSESSHVEDDSSLEL